MVMAMRDMHNIPMSCGLIILILQLGPCCRLFQSLEKVLACESKMLFEHLPQNSLFARLLQSKFFSTSELKTPSESVGPKLLPKMFLLQMDNYVKDNKNRYLLTCLLLLMEREVFEEVKLGFLVVGHTHENIDGCFGYCPKS
jgi:hypothetical protein